MASAVTFRHLSPEDDIEALTLLIRRAYKQLADLGLRYVATWQGADITLKRTKTGECWVGELEGRIVATIILSYPPPHPESEWYKKPGVALVQQFAVEPELQRTGIGSALIDLMESRAAELGVSELALDTSEKATHLIEYYKKRGYRFVEFADWDVTNYRSVVLSKTLSSQNT